MIHLERSLFPRSSAFKFWELLLYQQSLKQEEQFELIMEDCYFDSAATDVVDFAVGAGGSIGYLNLRGFYRQERTAKVQRIVEIVEEVKSCGLVMPTASPGATQRD